MSDDTRSGGQPDSQVSFWDRTKIKWITGAIGAIILAVIGALAQDVVQRVIGEPTGIDVSVSQGDECNARGWVYPEGPDSELMNTPPGTGKRIKGKTWDQDPDAFGSVPAGPVKLNMVVTAKAARRAVLLHKLTFRVTEKKKAMQGTPGCSGPLPASVTW
ncbi:hypothetical protein [Streptomyces syringium]|uniref:hypothetical protein n=1 Tax=Streptomyces syringium TaxID=76729 RepID=UPI0033BFD26E